MKSKRGFTNKEVTDKPIAEWDISALCVAFQAVLISSDVDEKVKEVRASRNDTVHVREASCDDPRKSCAGCAEPDRAC